MILRALDPETELELFQEAYSWRTTRKHTRPERAPFAAFIADDPHQIVLGLFKVDELLAVYLLYEYEPDCYECHFTCRRGVKRETALGGAWQIVEWFKEHNMKEMVAWIMPRNRPLQQFVEDLGFQFVEAKTFPCNGVSDCPTILPTRVFLKYAILGK